MGARNRFTVFDQLEAKGYFESNPANASSGAMHVKQEYPRMLYHPEGETRITVPGTEIDTPRGPKTVGEQRELISIIVKDEKEEAIKISEGWHRHPARAIGASGKVAPMISSDEQIKELKAQMAVLQNALDDANLDKAPVASPLVPASPKVSNVRQ